MFCIYACQDEEATYLWIPESHHFLMGLILPSWDVEDAFEARLAILGASAFSALERSER